MTKNIVAGVLVIAALFIGYSIGGRAVVEESIGSGANPSGPLHQTKESFAQGLTGGARSQFDVSNGGAVITGGTVLSTSTVSTSFGTLTAVQLYLNSTIVMIPNISSATTTLPFASSTQTLFSAVGQTKTWTIINGTSTSAKTVAIAAPGGGGIDLDATTLNNVQIAPGASGRLTCTAITVGLSIRCQFVQLVVGD